MTGTGRDPRKGIFLSLGLIVSWLLAVYYPQPVGEFGIVRGYTIAYINNEAISNECILISQNPMETIYVVEVLLHCSTESCRNAAKVPPRPAPPGDKGEMQVINTVVHLVLHLHH